MSAARYCSRCYRAAGAGDVSECCSAAIAGPRRHDWSFDAALLAFFIALMLLAWMAARYVPGAPLNLLARVQALEAGRCTCR